MATFTKVFLSESSNGASIAVSSTASPGVLVHSTQTNNTDVDEVWLYANNYSASDANLTIFWGSTAANNNLGPVTIQAYTGTTLLSPGLIMRGSGSTASTVYAFASSTGSVNIVGYVNRILA
jgi:hypothetical protein